MRRRRPVRALLLVAGGVALLVMGLVSTGAEAAGPGFFGYTFIADSDGIQQTGGSPSSQGYPQAASQTAHSEARIDTGPNGYALASTEWPGKFVGNFGSLAQVFGAPEEAGGLNYPVRAEAGSSTNTRDQADPGMLAIAEGATAEAFATVDGYDGDGSQAMTFGDVQSHSRAALEGAIGTSKAETDVSNFSLADGLITIESIRTVAAVSTDGKTGTATGSVVVSGVEVANQPARVDENGVHAGSSSNPNGADAVAQQIIDQALAGSQGNAVIQMRTTTPFVRNEGAIQEYRSGALLIQMSLGDPSGDGGIGTFVIGGSNAIVQATQGEDFSSLPPPAAPIATPPDTSGGTIDTSTPEVTTPEVTEPAPTTPEAPADTGVDEVAAPGFIPVGRFGGLPFAMPFFILLGSLAIGRGLHQLHESLVNAPAGTACIGEGDR